ncbi:MAG: hypothetical protein AB7I24_15715, partial [Candidatus Nanopelagicales bacterium]
AERLEQERLEQERLEAERLEAGRLEQERLEQERLEAERREQERLAAAQAAEEMARWAAEQEELERAAAIALESEQQHVVAEPSPWTEQPAAFLPEADAPAAAAASTFADIYGEPVPAASSDAFVPEPEPVGVPVGAAPARDYSGGFMATPEVAQPQASDGADMAALLRELSSLGNDSEPARPASGSGPSPAAAPQVVTRPIQAEKPKKKRGLFGR